jgi:hypothetical protein
MNLAPILNAFPKKIQVRFIHASSGQLLGVHKMKPDQLPPAFDKPTYIEFEDKQWRVMHADPLHTNELATATKLVLHVAEPGSIDPATIWADFPTICTDWPEDSPEPLFPDFILDVKKESWRQLEILPVDLLTEVQEEMVTIETFLYPGEDISTLPCYKNVYPRKTIVPGISHIGKEEFCALLNIHKKGAIRHFSGDFVKNGFAFCSDNYTYYGILKGDRIEELYLQDFESIDEEIYELVTAYNLLLADWRNGKIIMV